MNYLPIYLVFVGAEANNNKFYRMLPQGDGTFIAEWGRIGNPKFQSTSFSMSLWDKKYRDKTGKGYEDKTELVADIINESITVSGTKEYIDIQNNIIKKIVERLQAMAKDAIEKNYTISSNKVTQAMIDEAQDLLTKLSNETTIEKFNSLLLELFKVIPRKMKKVADNLAETKTQFARIIEGEQDLLDVMKGQVVTKAVIDEEQKTEVTNDFTILEALGLEFEECDDKDIDIIKMKLGGAANQFKNAWRVSNKKTKVKYDKYLADEGLVNCTKDTKLLWHGSRNENWWSIINGGLVLKPTNAVITGKMFGYGTYFATKARKSIGYTSLSGSYWAGGNSNTAFMGLYEVAYGNPYDVHSFDSKYYNFNYDSLQRTKPGAHCLHAHEGTMLRNDEIIVYKEAQTTIKYLVEISN